MWFQKILVRFFMSIDKTLYNFIATLYDLLIAISRTSVLTQGDIAQFATRIEILLGIFMLFKLSFSLITYIVNPDDFTDKQKGFGKLVQNSVISLTMLVLVPYIFQMAFNLQSKILNDNLLAKLLLGERIMDNDKTDDDGKVVPNNIIDSAGDRMAFYVMLPVFSPRLSIGDLNKCVNLYDSDGTFNDDCYEALRKAGMENRSDSQGSKWGPWLENYAAGVQNESLGLTFRLNAALDTADFNNGEEGKEFIIDYKYPLSTAIAVITCLLLITFCIDIGVRSIKLAFLQLIYPIPVISFMDPKSGKDGIFSKWYKMCLSTFLSLFIRLLTLYFGIYVISRVCRHGMVDIINGSEITNGWVKIFIILGILMFVKQMPKILENLGIKLDGDGKFSLNPLKRLEEGSFGGKAITGAAAGFAIGALGNKGNPFKAASGMIRGAVGNQGFGATAKHQADVNRQLRQAKLDGSSFGGRLNARWTNLTGAKGINNVEKARKRIDALNETSGAISKMEDRAIEKIKSGEAGSLSSKYLGMKAETERLQKQYSETGNASYTRDGVTYTGSDAVAQSQMDANNFLNNEAKYRYMDAMLNGTENNGVIQYTYKHKDANNNVVEEASTLNIGIDQTFKSQEATWRSKSQGVSDANIPEYAEAIHGEMGRQKGRISELDNDTRAQNASNEADKKYVEAAKWKK